MKETQQSLPGIPAAPKLQQWKINYQYQGKNYRLAAGALVLPAEKIELARILANGTLKEIYGDKWFNITKIEMTNKDEAPF